MTDLREARNKGYVFCSSSRSHSLWFAFQPAENPWPTPPLRGIDG
jgi:hypothetical protein